MVHLKFLNRLFSRENNVRTLIVLRIVFALFVGSTTLHAQTSEDLKKQQEKISKEIEQIQSILESNEKNKEETLGSLQLTKEKLALRKKLLVSLNEEIKTVEKNITDLSLSTKKTQQQLVLLKENFKRNVLNFYINKHNNSWFQYFLNSKSVSTSVRLFTYFRNYQESQQKQVQRIKEVKTDLEHQLTSISREKKKKETVLSKQGEEMKKLQKEQKEQIYLSLKLKKRSSSLRQQIREKVKKQENLRSAILKAIRKEIEEEEARKKEEERRRKEEEEKRAQKPSANPVTPKGNTNASTSSTTKSNASVNIDFSKIEENFIAQKGKMPWPVNGNILSSYGSDIFEGATVSGRNIGTIFRTTENSSVHCIAQGIVSSSVLFQGIYTVIVRHGNYFSGYSNLSSISVKKGDVLTDGQEIGKSAKSQDGDWGEVVLQVASLKGNVNPESWIRK